MSRKVIINCDPGIDAAVALCIALFEPRFEVVAVTATAGVVPAPLANRNVQAILDQLDPPRLPRFGSAQPLVDKSFDWRSLHGSDGLADAPLAVSQLHHRHPADKIIADEIRSAADQVTLLCLGPLTNVARAFQREPSLVAQVDRLFMMGGSVDGIGNVTACAEFNMYYDPDSAQQVFHSPTTKTLIPLDTTSRVAFELDFVEQLPAETTRAGFLLRHLLPYYFRSYRQSLGQESILLHDVVALVAAVHPELFTMEEMIADVETAGELTTGATIFDRRPHTSALPNMEVAVNVDASGVYDYVVRALRRCGELTA